MKREILAGILSVILVGQTGAAALVGVNFTGNSQSPTNWTRISTASPSTINNLIDESGAATNISISFSGVNESFFSGSGLTSSTVPIHTPSLAALNGNVDSTSSGATFTATFSNLAPDSFYDFWVFAARFTGVTSQAVTITGASTTTFTQNGAAGELVVNSLVGSSSQPLSFYALPIESDVNGQITTTFNLTAVRGYGVSGFALQQSTPEPGTLTLFSIGIVGLAGRMRMLRRDRRSPRHVVMGNSL